MQIKNSGGIQSVEVQFEDLDKSDLVIDQIEWKAITINAG